MIRGSKYWRVKIILKVAGVHNDTMTRGKLTIYERTIKWMENER